MNVLLYQKSHPNFHDLKWLVSALNIKDVNSFLSRHIYVADGNIYATDAHRLHAILGGKDRLSLDSGAYAVVKSVNAEIQLRKLADEEIENFPPFLAILPVIHSDDSTRIMDEDVIKKTLSAIRLKAYAQDRLPYYIQTVRTLFYTLLKEDGEHGITLLEHRYLEDAAVGLGDRCTMYLNKEKDHSACILVNDHHLVLVMPHRIHEDMHGIAKKALGMETEATEGEMGDEI